jgi:class 3 adenylate cyclase
MTRPSSHIGLGQVARVLKDLAEASQFQRNRDWRLRDAIGSVLNEVGADALIMRVGVDGNLLSAFHYCLNFDRARKENEIFKAQIIAMDLHKIGVIYRCHVEAETRLERLFFFPEFQFKTETGRNIAPVQPEFFCFVSGLRRSKDGSPIYQSRWHKIVAPEKPTVFVTDSYRDAVESYCRAIQLAMMRRDESDSIFPTNVSRKFWNVVDDKDPFRARIRPWDEDESGRAATVPTASLSFDLRQSTFAMDQAIDKKFHADWLEGMVIILRQLTHMHGGVFDKFTGDGVISHFPIYSFVSDVKSTAAASEVIKNSVICAWDMIRAIDFFVAKMLPNIALKKSTFGASVGVAFDDAQWSVDRVGNPIVVGRGVVHACRLSDGPPDTVQVSNAVITRLEMDLPDLQGHKELDFVSKEYETGSDVKMTRMTIAPPGIGTDAVTLKNLVQGVLLPR